MSKEKKNIDYEVLSRQILIPSRNLFSFFDEYNNLYNFWFNLLFKNINLDDVKSQKIKFLKDLMNGFNVYKKIKKPKNELNYKAEDLYLLLLGNPNKTVNGIFLNKPKDKNNKEIYLQAQILFDLREKIFKKLFNKKIIKSDSDQSGIEEYEESIVERTKLRRQELEIIKDKEKNINNDSFKKYFKYQSPSNMYNSLSDIKNTEKHNTSVNLIKSGLIDLKKDIKNESKYDVNKIEEMYKLEVIVELILNFNDQTQEGDGIKILTPNQMLSKLPITLAQLKAGNNSEKLKNEIRQLLHSLYRSKKLTKQIYKSLINIV